MRRPSAPGRGLRRILPRGGEAGEGAEHLGGVHDRQQLAPRAAVAVLALTGLNALLVAGRLAVEWTAVVTVAEAIGGGPLGGLLLALLQIGWLPTFTAWSIAWTAGPGFSVGADSLYSVFGATSATAPALPALGALPGTWSPWRRALRCTRRSTCCAATSMPAARSGS